MIIYKLTNIENNKIYVGCTIRSLNDRFKAHRYQRSDSKKATHIQRAFFKYEKESFIIEQLDSAVSKEEMFLKEIFWIKKYDSTNSEIGYNLSTGGGGLGRYLTREERKELGNKLKGKPCSEETKLKISLAQKGIPKSKESVEKARISKTGKKQSKEHIEKARLSRMGYSHSEETKEKIRNSNMGQLRTTETRENLSKARKKYTTENRDKLGTPILCLNNNIIYPSMTIAAEQLKICRSNISRQIKGELTQVKGYKFTIT